MAKQKQPEDLVLKHACFHDMIYYCPGTDCDFTIDCGKMQKDLKDLKKRLDRLEQAFGILGDVGKRIK